jgi:hypothetical protein
LETVRALETLRETPDNHDAVSRLADVLGMWTAHMVSIRPEAASRIYDAITAAWGDIRAEYDYCEDTSPARDRAEAEARERSEAQDRETCDFHRLLLQCFDEAAGRPITHRPKYPGEIKCQEELRLLIIERLIAIRGRLFSDIPPVADRPTEGRLSELRSRLDRVNKDDITNCSAILKLEKQIYDLEHPPGTDDWSAWEEKEGDAATT